MKCGSSLESAGDTADAKWRAQRHAGSLFSFQTLIRELKMAKSYRTCVMTLSEPHNKSFDGSFIYDSASHAWLNAACDPEIRF